jgi:adenylate cyclase
MMGVNLAFDIQAEVGRRTFGGRRLAFRTGINSGPVVAGVIGRKKFSYDLWGEAVNMASRMESHGQSGVIQISRNTIGLVGGLAAVGASGAVYAVDNGLSESPCQIRFRRVRIARTMEESAGFTRFF